MNKFSRPTFLQGGAVGLGIAGSGLRAWALNRDFVEALVIGSGFGVRSRRCASVRLVSKQLCWNEGNAKWVNQGIELIERLNTGGSISTSEYGALVRVAGQILEPKEPPCKKVVIHRYFPQRPLGNDLGMLSFGLPETLKIIEEGEHAALNHDCQADGCALA